MTTRGHFGLLMAAAGGGGGDPYFANVSALLHMDGTDGSTTFTDVIGNTWTAGSGAEIDTALSKFGGASGLFPQAGGQINTGSDARFGFGSGDYTVEGWLARISGSSGNRCLLDTRTGSNAGIGIYMNTATLSGLSIQNNSTTIAGSSTGFTNGTFQHWAVVREGTNVYGYQDGVMVFSGTDSRTLASASSCFIGDNYLSGSSPSQPVGANLDEIRITKGVCRYPGGSTFTPPSSPFPDS